MLVSFITLGCKVNQYDTETLTELLNSRGFEVTQDKEKADVIILNSCTVTSNSDIKMRRQINRIKKENPNAILVLTGCFPQAYPDTASNLKGVDIISGTANRSKLPELIEKYIQDKKQLIEVQSHSNIFENIPITKLKGHTRSFLKIEDGCENYCSYCIIPTARGRVRSKRPEDIRHELVSLANSGYKEVVLVGINLTSYGKDIGLNLCDAVELACSVDGIERIRLGSLEPDFFTDEVIARLAKQSKLCPHFHLSLQSGCDETLKRMNRHYTTAEYKAVVEKLRSNFENCAITTDIMVGFPGETDEEFTQTLQFVKSISFARAHVFIYSPRKGTRAAEIKEQVDKKTAAVRSQSLIRATKGSQIEFMKKQIDKILLVLIETKNSQGYFEGYSENYTPVKVLSDNLEIGSIVPVKILSVEGNYCNGKAETE